MNHSVWYYLVVWSAISFTKKDSEERRVELEHKGQTDGLKYKPSMQSGQKLLAILQWDFDREIQNTYTSYYKYYVRDMFIRLFKSYYMSKKHNNTKSSTPHGDMHTPCTHTHRHNTHTHSDTTHTHSQTQHTHTHRHNTLTDTTQTQHTHRHNTHTDTTHTLTDTSLFYLKHLCSMS